MSDVLTRGTMFPPQVVSDMFNMVAGHSSLAALADQTPIPFNGTDVFTFTLDKNEMPAPPRRWIVADAQGNLSEKPYTDNRFTLPPLSIVALEF